MMLGDLHAPAVHADVVVRWIGFRPELAHGDAVHADAPLEHQRFAGAARGDSRLRQDFL